MLSGNLRIVVVYPVCTDIEAPEVLGAVAAKLLQAEIIDRMVLHALGPYEPPGEPNDPLNEKGLHRAHRRQLGQHGIAMNVVLVLTFVPDDIFLDEQPVLEGILRDRLLAFSRLGPGGFLRITTICFRLSFRSHLFSPFGK
jgi:hypothetical protein